MLFFWVLQGWLFREYLEEVNPEDKLFWEPVLSAPILLKREQKKKGMGVAGDLSNR
jgi:hypothetical protein